MLVTNKTKRIFNREVAVELVELGFKVVRKEIHKDNDNWIIYHFEDIEAMRTALTCITNKIKLKKILIF